MDAGCGIGTTYCSGFFSIEGYSKAAHQWIWSGYEGYDEGYYTGNSVGAGVWDINKSFELSSFHSDITGKIRLILDLMVQLDSDWVGTPYLEVLLNWASITTIIIKSYAIYGDR